MTCTRSKRFHRAAWLAAILAIAGCSGGGSPPPRAIEPTPSPTPAPLHSATPSATASPSPTPSASPSPTPSASPSPSPTPAQKIYLAIESDIINVYAPNPVGTLNEAPLATIGGSNTGLSYPEDVAVDSSGNIYAANLGQGNPINSSITVYPPNPVGIVNEAPIGTIAGGNAMMADGDRLAVDAYGKIYVSNNVNNSVTVYLQNPMGTLNESPIGEIEGSNTQIVSPEGIALDANGNIYVANLGGDGNQYASITVFAANPRGALNETPTGEISGNNTGISYVSGVALDASGRIYVLNQATGNGDGPPNAEVFAANPNGIVNEAPLATITGSNTGLDGPQSIALDATGKIYVANSPFDGSPSSITVYAPNPVGTLNEAPIATITGSNTNMPARQIEGIAVH